MPRTSQLDAVTPVAPLETEAATATKVEEPVVAATPAEANVLAEEAAPVVEAAKVEEEAPKAVVA